MDKSIYRSLSANNAALAKSLQRVQKKNKKLTHLVNTQNLMLHKMINNRRVVVRRCRKIFSDLLEALLLLEGEEEVKNNENQSFTYQEAEDDAEHIVNKEILSCRSTSGAIEERDISLDVTEEDIYNKLCPKKVVIRIERMDCEPTTSLESKTKTQHLPKRRARPINLKEPKLNTKLRRPSIS